MVCGFVEIPVTHFEKPLSSMYNFIIDGAIRGTSQMADMVLPRKYLWLCVNVDIKLKVCYLFGTYTEFFLCHTLWDKKIFVTISFCLGLLFL